MSGRVIALLFVSMLGAGCREAPVPVPPEPSSLAPSDTSSRQPSLLPHYGIEIIDSHVHIVPSLSALAVALDVLEGSGIKLFVAKSGGSWDTPRFWSTVAMKRVLGDRFEFFCNIDWDDIDDPDFAERTALGLEKAAAAGAKGIKIFKALGLQVRTADGKLVTVDDPRLDPIFEKAGELGLIMAMHTADPVAFFEPPTPDNERYEELSIASRWSFYGEDFPSHDELLAQRDRRLARHPGTKFLLIHLANHPENLEYVDGLLDTYPNVWVDTSARVPEFGRHPADQVRAFFIKHQDRILFGSDIVVSGRGLQLGSVADEPPTIADGIRFYERHFEYFETDHRQMEHPTPIQGRWKVDAINLPAEVLRKLYHDNAWKLIYGAKVRAEQRRGVEKPSGREEI